MKLREKTSLLAGLPKSLYYNVRLFGLKNGIRLPVLFGRKCHVHISQGTQFSIPENYRFGMVKIGIHYGPFLKGYGSNSYFRIADNGTISFLGPCNISAGCAINISGGSCTFGKRITANAGFIISCEKEITLGDDVLIGWDCTIIDGDGHRIINSSTNEHLNKPRPVKIGNHVWIAAQASILKGCLVEDNTVIGYSSIVTGIHKTPNCILVGNPAHSIRDSINWVR